MNRVEGQIVEALTVFITDKGYSPSLRELMAASGVNSFRQLNASLKALRDSGVVLWEDGTSRTLRLVNVKDE